jgi:hypothetical protein
MAAAAVARRARLLRFTGGGSKTLRRGRTVETEQRFQMGL